MKNRLIKPSIEIRRSTISGYGVFATKNLRKGEVIEECPFILLKNVPNELLNYKFYDKNNNATFIPFGYGCIYNHAELPNAAWDFDENEQLIKFKALRNIYVGNEILTYYPPVWFSLREKKPKKPLPKNLFSFLARLTFILMVFFIIKLAIFPLHNSNQKIPDSSMAENINYKNPVSMKSDSSFKKLAHRV